MSERDALIVRKILEYCKKTASAVERFGNMYDVWVNDSVYRDVCAMYILQIGELSVHLSDEFRRTHTEIPWNEIRGMRNIVAHGYGSVSKDTLWETVQDDVPALKAYCETIIT